MSNKSIVMIAHPDAAIRGGLRTLLEKADCTVVTGATAVEMMRGGLRGSPALFLLSRNEFAVEGMKVLVELTRKWTDAEVVLLPEGLRAGSALSTFGDQIVQIVRRVLSLRPTRELLAV